MAEPVKNLPPMTTDEFLRWYQTQPDGLRFELFDGVVYPRRSPSILQSERIAHARLKAAVLVQLADQIRRKSLPCEALGDGMAVRVGPKTTFEPDALLRCGGDLPDDTVALDDVMAVVEVASPSTERLDTGRKLLRYFRNPSLVHYVVVLGEERAIVHHRRDAAGRIELMPSDSRLLQLDPPGIELDIEALFAKG